MNEEARREFVALLTRTAISAKSILDAMPIKTVDQIRRYSEMSAAIARTLATIDRLKGKL